MSHYSPEAHLGLLRFLPGYGELQPLADNPLVYARDGVTDSLKSHDLVVIALIGPSTVGKSTLFKQATEYFNAHADSGNTPFLSRPTTTTTRMPREGETDIDYHFIPSQEFLAEVVTGQFIETVRQGKGDRYGTKKEDMNRVIKQAQKKPNGKVIVWPGDIQGLPSMEHWVNTQHPDTPFLTCTILPNLNIIDFSLRLLQLRGFTAGFIRLFRAITQEIIQAGQVSDIVVFNQINSDHRGLQESVQALTQLLSLVGANGRSPS